MSVTVEVTEPVQIEPKRTVPLFQRPTRAARVLVTGGGGFIGRSTCAELHRRGHSPIMFDTHREPDDWPHIIGDVRDATAVTEAVAGVEGVIHLAGVLGTQETIANPLPAIDTNILGGINVFEACVQYGVPLVNIAVGNWFEFSTYSISKHTVERFAEMYSRFRGLNVSVVRAFNAYGPGQSVAQPHGHSRVRKIMPSFISRALHGEDIEVYGAGNQIMDMIYVSDVASVLASALEAVDGSGFKVYDAGTGRHTSVLDIAKLVRDEVARQTGTKVAIKHLPMRPGETPGVEVLGDPRTLVPLHIDNKDFLLLEDGVARTVGYYRMVFNK